MRGRLLLVLGTMLAAGASAQVHRCVDAAGKVSFSDIACPTSAKKADQVMGESATQQRWEPEGYRAQQNLDSINRARALQQESVDVVTRQSQGESGAAAIGSSPAPAPQRRDPAYSDGCDTQSTRKGCIGGARAANPNWSARRGYYGSGGAADQRYEAEQERAREAAAREAARGPVQVTNCELSGCWDTAGNRYNRTGDGQTFIRSDGRFCRGTGRTINCN